MARKHQRRAGRRTPVEAGPRKPRAADHPRGPRSSQLEPQPHGRGPRHQPHHAVQEDEAAGVGRRIAGGGTIVPLADNPRQRRTVRVKGAAFRPCRPSALLKVARNLIRPLTHPGIVGRRFFVAGRPFGPHCWAVCDRPFLRSPSSCPQLLQPESPKPTRTTAAKRHWPDRSFVPQPPRKALMALVDVQT